MLWGALNNSSTAMMAMTVDLGSISQNVANVNTTGYKTTQTMFKTMLSEGHAATGSSGPLNIFGVKTAQRNLIDAQGVITPSNTWSDLAISGSGFFMVENGTASSPSLTDPNAVMYTRDGSFHRVNGDDTDPDLVRQYFATETGQYLLGYMADDTGAIPNGASLEPIYTLAPRPIPNNGTAAVNNNATMAAVQTMTGRATTTASIAANIPSGAQMTASDYDATMSITDPFGATQTMTLNWTRTSPDMWTVTPSVPAGIGTVTSGAFTVEMDTFGNVIWPATDPDVVVDWDDPTYGAATADGTVTVTASATSPTMHLEKIPLQVYDNVYAEHEIILGFERIGTNTWVLHADPGADSTSQPASIQLDFDQDGQLTTNTPVSFAFSWTDSNGVASTADVAVDLDRVTQYNFSSTYIGTVDQDGYSSGNLASASFTDTGELVGYFDNYRSRILGKLPIANFTAENSLQALSGNLFARTAEAGELMVSNIEDAPGEPRFTTSALENSTVDIEEEFTKMIMTQKAYSTNAQVFKTADEMSVTARDLKA